MTNVILHEQPWTVYKFGGSSLKDAHCFKQVSEIIQKKSDQYPLAVVVSAIYNTTNLLFNLIKLSKQNQITELLNEIESKHISIVADLIANKNLLDQLKDNIKRDISTIRQLLAQAPIHEQIKAEIIGFGEQWSMMILGAFLTNQNNSVKTINARSFLTIESHDTGPSVDWDLSQNALNEILSNNPNQLLIVTGYLASNKNKKPSLLQRNGSDHSAAILGALLKARAIHIWTDVDGLYTADPNRIKEVKLINEIQYQEAAELAYFGSEVLHPKTIEPAVNQNIPIFIRNTFNSKEIGTKITGKTTSETNHPSTCVKGFSTIKNIALINVEGAGMIGVPGIAQRIFNALKEAKISVIMISQASSEYSICFAIHSHQQTAAISVLKKVFELEIKQQTIASIQANSNCCILAAVGNQMAKTPGVSARFFSALANANINVLAIAQGSSERNISVVINNDDATRALQIVHSSFFLSDCSLSIGIIGPGNIGKELLLQLKMNHTFLKNNKNIDLRVRGIMSSKKMILTDSNYLHSNWEKTYESSTTTSNFEDFIQHINAEHFSHRIIIDCTASQDIANTYKTLLKNNISIITPNKKANSGKLNYFKELHDSKLSAHYLYESTVGAGLPIISTLKDILNTGDSVLKIEGVFSGTLSYIFNELSRGQTFTQAVNTAYTQGLTEPDVRDDLSGMDVARKVLILSRVMNLKLELEDVTVENLIPDSLKTVHNTKEFLSQLAGQDKKINQLVNNARVNNQIIRYVGSVSSQGADARIRTFSTNHPFANLNGTDNIIAFYTERYNKQPLIIQGPGAGPSVTAAGIFADILRLSSFLGSVS